MARIVKTVLVKIYEPNKGKLESLDRIIDTFSQAVNFYLDVINKLGKYHIIHIAKKQGKFVLNYLERETIASKKHPFPKYPINIKGLNTDLRRSAINHAIGMVKSFVSNLINWHKEGKELEHRKPSYPKPKNFAPQLYSSLVKLDDLWIRKYKKFHFVKIKVLDEKYNWIWKNYPVKIHKLLLKYLNEGFKPLRSAKLIKREDGYYLAITLVKNAKYKQLKKPKYLISVDLNIVRNLACIGIFSIDWKDNKAKLERIRFINNSYLQKLIRKRDYLLHLIQLKQHLTGRRPVKGDNKKLWKKVRNLNREISLKVAKLLTDLASGYKDSVIVLEKLKGLKPNRKKNGKWLNKRLNYWLRSKIVKRIGELKYEKGIGLIYVNPKNTSISCSKCGTVGERFSPNGSKALFKCLKCGYTVNADVNAVFNIASRGYSRLLNAGREEARCVVRVGTSLKSSSNEEHNLSGVPKATAPFNNNCVCLSIS